MPDQVVQTIRVESLTLVSLHVEVYFDSKQIGDATGFVCERGGVHHLVTNWHVLSGRNPETSKPLSKEGTTPNRIQIWHHAKNQLGRWVRREELLYEGDKPRWKEHPLDRAIDVVALPITPRREICFCPLDLRLAETDLIVSPSEPVSVIGFPRGVAAAAKFPIWKTAHVASDLDLSVDAKPLFVIDTATKPGMSGSPVFAYRVGCPIRTSQGSRLAPGAVTRFLGIYSGRIDDEGTGLEDRFNLGRVWKAGVVNQLLEQ